MPPNPESPGQFAQRPIPVLSSTPLHVRGLCHGHWQWFQFVTTGQRSVTTFARQTPLPPDTVVRTVRRATTVSETQAVVVQFDSMWVETQNRYATSDVIIVNGMGALNAMPSQWDVPATFNPTQAAAAAVPGTVFYRPGVDSLTLTLGFNTTLGDQGCASLVHPLVMVGVRCSWGSMLGFGCPFDIAATRVPRQVSDGDVITAPIEPDAMHYFAINVGSFDVLSLSLRRLERFSTYVDDLTGQARDHVDHGLLGSLIVSRNTCPTAVNVFRPPPPPPVGKGGGAAAVSVLPDVRVVPIVNSTEYLPECLFDDLSECMLIASLIRCVSCQSSTRLSSRTRRSSARRRPKLDGMRSLCTRRPSSRPSACNTSARAAPTGTWAPNTSRCTRPCGPGRRRPRATLIGPTTR
jgi:hypothetical protein